jgi:hypothetical protein
VCSGRSVIHRLATVAKRRSCANEGSHRGHAVDRSTRNQRPIPPSGEGGYEEKGSYWRATNDLFHRLATVATKLISASDNPTVSERLYLRTDPVMEFDWGTEPTRRPEDTNAGHSRPTSDDC